MKSLHSFLNPVRKPNKKFVLSSAFVGEDGQPIEWEMRALSAAETADIMKQCDGLDGQETLSRQVAASLVYPNLRDAELVKAMAERNNGKIMEPWEILLQLITGAEYNKLVGVFSEQNQVTMDFGELVEEAKN